MVSENLVQKKQIEIEVLKQKLEKKLADDDKYLIRNRNNFEKHFGRQPRPAEEKVNLFFNVICFFSMLTF